MKAVAENKKAQNIGEYIIYMYQMEDLIRAYQFDISEINQYVISHYPISAAEKENTKKWFEELIREMKKESIMEEGHLSFIQSTVDDLARIHWDLLKTDREYFDLYAKAKPYVIDFILEAGEKSPGHEIQICLNAIYGLLLSRLKGREVPKDILAATSAFGKILSYLNQVYLNLQNQKVRNN